MSDERPRRVWGYWTEAKLDILRKYLDAFSTASTRAGKRVYLDAFAGEGRGLSRTWGNEFDGSPRIALEVADPAFDRLLFFERAPTAGRLESKLRTDFPGPDFEVIAGDCNETIPEALGELRRTDLSWPPTFAFLDPDGMELRWETVEALARHKAGRKYKVELWMLFNVSGLMRVLSKDPAKVSEENARKATLLFGGDRWRDIQELRFAGSIEPAEARDQFVNLYRWQLQHELGYVWTHALEVRDANDHPLYTMIFATDNEAGNNIMSWLYNDAASRYPAMRQEARDRTRGQLALGFDEVVDTEPTDIYRNEPPWLPPGIAHGT